MNDNPYRPPTANVADIAEPDHSVRPRLVNVAAALLCATFAVGLISSVVQWKLAEYQGPFSLIIFTTTFSIGLMGWLTYKLWQGRNWARIVILVLLVVGTPVSLPQLPAIFARSPTSGVIFVLQTAAQIAALSIVFFTSARHWFTRTKNISAATQATAS